ncbi:MAG: thiol-disulfide oxidoreductase DCC family protein [Cytophagaceae bacterium]|nr:thiol-disulfide oxidoreductase DCC family protein [Cytophagaceae bacterium]
MNLILFDGVCNFCNASINFVIDHDPNQRFKFAALQSEIGQEYLRKIGRETRDFDSVLLIENGQLYTKSDAALRIARHLEGWAWLWFLRGLPYFLRDGVYTLIANNRYRLFGKRDACRIPTPEERERFVV